MVSATEMRTLAADRFAELYETFTAAFSDYVVKFSPDEAALREMLVRRGWVPELSAGAFDHGKLVGFTLNCLDGGIGYDSGTGVIPSHRRSGLARRLMEYSASLLRNAGAERYLLEVIEANSAAVELYRRCGFEQTRGLQCWSWEPPPGAAKAGASDRKQPPWDALPMWDVQPSWQNSTASLQRARQPYTFLGNENAYAVVFPATGDLPQLAVRHDHRRQGLGRQLLEAAGAEAGKPLRILNVDDRDEGIAAFLMAAGAQKTVRQLEMAMAL
jgi:ribosomal protein S18 acetylase RimI-like enzyme